MEVHAHTHPSASSGHHKKWTHYLWEFLMLFLAVFCGFLAENWREHIVEHQREKEFMISMLSDLKADTTNLRQIRVTFANTINHIDTINALLKGDISNLENATKIYQQYVNIYDYFKWNYTDRTVEQLKNSGNFRLIRKKNVSDMIMNYDVGIRGFVGNMQDMYLLPELRLMSDAAREVFYSSVVRNYYKERSGYHPVQLPEKPWFISVEKNKIQKFINLSEEYALSVESFIVNTKYATDMAVKLDSLIRKEYHLK